MAMSSSASRIVPGLLSFVAGYVDACTFLLLFGLFVAQATGSFVIIGTEVATHEAGFTIKVLAIPVFFVAGVLTSVLAECLLQRGRSALAWMLALEWALTPLTMIATAGPTL